MGHSQSITVNHDCNKVYGTLLEPYFWIFVSTIFFLVIQFVFEEILLTMQPCIRFMDSHGCHCLHKLLRDSGNAVQNSVTTPAAVSSPSDTPVQAKTDPMVKGEIALSLLDEVEAPKEVVISPVAATTPAASSAASAQVNTDPMVEGGISPLDKVEAPKEDANAPVPATTAVETASSAEEQRKSPLFLQLQILNACITAILALNPEI